LHSTPTADEQSEKINAVKKQNAELADNAAKLHKASYASQRQRRSTKRKDTTIGTWPLLGYTAQNKGIWMMPMPSCNRAHKETSGFVPQLLAVVCCAAASAFKRKELQWAAGVMDRHGAGALVGFYGAGGPMARYDVGGPMGRYGADGPMGRYGAGGPMGRYGAEGPMGRYGAGRPLGS
jgi:hypothetical protein